MNIRSNVLILLLFLPCMMSAIITDEIARDPQFKAKYPKKCTEYHQAERAVANSSLYQQSKKAKQEVFSFGLENKQVISHPRALVYWAKGQLPRENIGAGDFSLRAFKKNCKDSIIGYKESYNESYLSCGTPACELAREMIKEFAAQKGRAIEEAKKLEARLDASPEWKDFIEASKEIDQAYYNDKELYGKI